MPRYVDYEYQARDQYSSDHFWHQQVLCLKALLKKHEIWKMHWLDIKSFSNQVHPLFSALWRNYLWLNAPPLTPWSVLHTTKHPYRAFSLTWPAGLCKFVGTKESIYIRQEPISPERATSMRSCHGVFEDQFIFRTVLARILNIFKIQQTSQQNLQPKNDVFCLLITFGFPFWYVILRIRS